MAAVALFAVVLVTLWCAAAFAVGLVMCRAICWARGPEAATVAALPAPGLALPVPGLPVQRGSGEQLAPVVADAARD